jgi:hypothetical protein
MQPIPAPKQTSTAASLQPVSNGPNGTLQQVAMTPEAKALKAGWMRMKTRVFAGKEHTPDAEDPSTVNHLNWYESTNFMVPYPGEKKVLPASAFSKRKAPVGDADGD